MHTNGHSSTLPKCTKLERTIVSSITEWINTSYCIHTMEYYAAMRRKTAAPQGNTDEYHKCNIEQKQSDTKENIYKCKHRQNWFMVFEVRMVVAFVEIHCDKKKCEEDILGGLQSCFWSKCWLLESVHFRNIRWFFWTLTLCTSLGYGIVFKLRVYIVKEGKGRADVNPGYKNVSSRI